MELVALSELLERDIHVYHEQDDRVKIKKFTPKDTSSKLPKVSALYVDLNFVQIGLTFESAPGDVVVFW